MSVRRAMRLGLELAAADETGHADSPDHGPPREAEIEHSKAISLKRIADALDRLSATADHPIGRTITKSDWNQR